MDNYTRKDGTEVHICEGRYICYHRNRRLCKCDGSSSYRAKIIDGAADETIRAILNESGKYPDEKLITAALERSAAIDKVERTRLANVIRKYKEQLDLMISEIGNTLTGDSVYTAEELSSAISNLKERIAESENRFEELQNEEENRKVKSESIIAAFRRLKKWAREYDSVSFKEKKMIANKLFSRIEVGKGYTIRYEIDPDYRQFCERLIKAENE